jgi:hypothetical protein
LENEASVCCIKAFGVDEAMHVTRMLETVERVLDSLFYLEAEVDPVGELKIQMVVFVGKALKQIEATQMGSKTMWKTMRQMLKLDFDALVAETIKLQITRIYFMNIFMDSVRANTSQYMHTFGDMLNTWLPPIRGGGW